MTASISDSDVVAGSSPTSKSMSWSTDDVVIVYSNGRDSADNITSVTTTGSGLSFSAKEANTTNGRTQGALWTAIATASSSGTITANHSNTMDSAQVHFIVVQDANTIEDSNVASGSGTSPSTTVTPTTTDTLILGFIGVASGTATTTAGSGYTFVSGHQDVSDGVGGNSSSSSVEQKNETSTSAVTVDGTLSPSRAWVMYAVAIGTAAAGGADSITPLTGIIKRKRATYLRM